MIELNKAFLTLPRFYLLSLGLGEMSKAIVTVPDLGQIIGYYKYIKSIRHHVRGRICSSSMFGSEGSRSGLILSPNSGLCSGDTGFYSISNLLLHKFISSLKINKFSFQPNLSTLQYLNAILGSTLSSNTIIVSLSKFQLWSRLKSLIINSITNSSSCFIFNPKSRTRKRSLIYFLNFYNLMGSNLPLVVGSSLGLPSERVYITTISRFTLTLTTMTSLILLSPSTCLTLTNNNLLIFSNN